MGRDEPSKPLMAVRERQRWRRDGRRDEEEGKHLGDEVSG